MAEEAGNKNKKQKREKKRRDKKVTRSIGEARRKAGAPQGNKRQSERKSVQVQPGKRCSYLVEMKGLDEERSRSE